ncbi:hypothetical protein D9O29_15695 [Pantoea vagans]|uniref:Uncharacterized protein n=1 Tax=Pantoea vagans TaxID=470934 RepID=A0ABY3LDK4_9GAMM|nr:hypothetical protein D9O29_15695 [Pantoea vagans]
MAVHFGVHGPGLLARLRLGSARHPHVLRVRSGGCALSARNLAAPPTAFESDAECAADGLEHRFGGAEDGLVGVV